MSKRKRDPWINRVGIRVFGRAVRPVTACYWDGQHDGNPRYKPCSILEACTEKSLRRSQ
jgi:hypothetical protein